MKNDEYGDRMKMYEQVTRTVLPRRTFTIVRVDGRAFHTYLRRAEKPFDMGVMEAMRDTAEALCGEMSGARFAYTQSDEISVLLTDLDSKTQPWFGGEVQKIASVAASIATMAFNQHGQGKATFDARVYTIPDRTEVMNYFRWRQQDAIRNAVSMAAHAHFSHKSLHGVSTAQMQERLFQEEGINFKTAYPDGARRGWLIRRDLEFVDVPEEHQKAHGRPPYEPRTFWRSHAAPEFYVRKETALADLVPFNGSGPEQNDYVTLFGYAMGQALLATALEPAGALWAVETIRQELNDDEYLQAWMAGRNPHLDDRNPTFELLRGNVSGVMAAHRAHMNGDFA